MIRKFLFLGALGLVSFQGFAQTTAKAKPKPKMATAAPAALKTKLDSVSYAIGQDIGNSLKAQGLDNLNTALLMKAIQDATKNQKPLLTKEQCDMSISDYLQKLKGEKSAKNKEAGEQFLAANKAQR